jgi:hypothetical protein
MSKVIDHQSLDAALAEIANNGDTLHLCSAQPAAYANVAGLSLGHVALTPGDGNGSYVIQDLTAGGRRLTLAAQTVPGTAGGTATYAVIIDTTHSRIKAVTTAPNYTMTNGANQSVPGYDVCEIADPT